ncbi:MAG: SDR family oxidoreductase [Muribaculaceae bacterium]|nr:SDR family oxidoreductase [Muribaculaceae bacterium]
MGLIKRFLVRLFRLNEGTYYSLKNKKTAVLINDVDFGHILEGKEAIITGGTSGIGLAIAKKMIACGASVTIIGRNAEKAKTVAEEIRSRYLVLDLTDTSDMIKKVSQYISHLKVDILVNSAGVLDKENWLEKTPENYDLVMNTNLKATYFMCQTIAKHMIENKIQGHILNVSSSSSMRPSWGPYQLSKRALNGLTLGFAQRLAPNGITVNGLAPGVTMTPMASTFVKDTDNLAYYNPLRRAETPEEIANLAVFLTSNLGSSIVGDTVMITGGSGILSDEY